MPQPLMQAGLLRAYTDATSPKTPGELLFDFVRERDHKHFRYELRFTASRTDGRRSSSKGGVLLLAQGGFVTSRRGLGDDDAICD